ncbi:hypothetical protein TSUD_181940 [Trifolium subterraneum]|uniref:MULE transposase domain-containing protein n=1 Tax=Trifolium subterraneum TaxID=3900 RepID=A0A2Z6P1V9_TRISU|nr:hypothetical protein TSUD_181940 [Trifolium subterraneum]
MYLNPRVDGSIPTEGKNSTREGGGEDREVEVSGPPKLVGYAEELRRVSKGNTIKINVERPYLSLLPRFESFYFCFEGSKKGFIHGCRPFIGVDGCHLKTKYGGQLLIVVDRDPNNQYFPLVFGVVETETKDSWRWFLKLLMEDIGQDKGQQKFGGGTHIRDLMMGAAKETYYQGWLQKMNELKALDKKLATGARDKPIVTMCEWIKTYLMNRMATSATKLEKWQHRIMHMSMRRSLLYKGKYALCYDFGVSIINGMDMWLEPENAEEKPHILPPKYKTGPSRPKKMRIREFDENGVRKRKRGVIYKCTTCSSSQHNASTCKSKTQDPDALKRKRKQPKGKANTNSKAKQDNATSAVDEPKANMEASQSQDEAVYDCNMVDVLDPTLVKAVPEEEYEKKIQDVYPKAEEELVEVVDKQVKDKVVKDKPVVDKAKTVKKKLQWLNMLEEEDKVKGRR